jgi:hypothetical protein
VTTEEFGQGYALLVQNYRQQLKELDDDERKQQRTLYYKMLKDMDGVLWQEVVGVAIRSSKWFPKIAELVGHGAELSRLRGDTGGAEGAFELALRAVRRLDPLTLRPMSPVREDVDRTVRELGGWGRLGLVEDSELGWYRKEFISAWSGRNDILSRLGSVGDGVRGEGALGAIGQAVASLGEGSPHTTGWEGVLDVAERTPEVSGVDPSAAREGE